MNVDLILYLSISKSLEPRSYILGRRNRKGQGRSRSLHLRLRKIPKTFGHPQFQECNRCHIRGTSPNCSRLGLYIRYEPTYVELTGRSIGQLERTNRYPSRISH